MFGTVGDGGMDEIIPRAINIVAARAAVSPLNEELAINYGYKKGNSNDTR